MSRTCISGMLAALRDSRSKLLAINESRILRSGGLRGSALIAEREVQRALTRSAPGPWQDQVTRRSIDLDDTTVAVIQGWRGYQTAEFIA